MRTRYFSVSLKLQSDNIIRKLLLRQKRIYIYFCSTTKNKKVIKFLKFYIYQPMKTRYFSVSLKLQSDNIIRKLLPRRTRIYIYF